MNRHSLSKATFVLACSVLGACGGQVPTTNPTDTVATAEVVRGAMTLTREGASETVEGEARVESGATVATGADGRGSCFWQDADSGSERCPS